MRKVRKHLVNKLARHSRYTNRSLRQSLCLKKNTWDLVKFVMMCIYNITLYNLLIVKGGIWDHEKEYVTTNYKHRVLTKGLLHQLYIHIFTYRPAVHQVSSSRHNIFSTNYCQKHPSTNLGKGRGKRVCRKS